MRPHFRPPRLVEAGDPLEDCVTDKQSAKTTGGDVGEGMSVAA
jgi:hypothetical protein